MNEIYMRIEALCQAEGINITEMCRRSGATRGALTDLKMGRTAVLSAKTLSKIADYFGVSVDSLLKPGELSFDSMDVDGKPELQLNSAPLPSLDDQIRNARNGQKKEPAENDGLPESVRKLIEYAKTVPEDQAEVMLQTLQMMAAQADKMKEALRSDR